MTAFFYEQIKQYLQVKDIVLDRLPEALEQASDILIGALLMGRKVLTCGNGGSATDAQHLASELVNHFETIRRALPAVSLVSDSAVMTAVANDRGYDFLFARQIEALGSNGDVLVVFTTSGNSSNLIHAIKQAHQQGMRVIACTGKEGGTTAQYLNQYDIELRVPSQSTARIQEIHLFILHTLCKSVDLAFASHVSNTKLDKVHYQWDKLVQLTRGLRPLVFTNGVFDILHRGHVHYLQEARKQGSYLVVAINSDASTNRLNKNTHKNRPIQTGTDRAAILASLECVDFVTLFEENTPQALIDILRPDVLIKGGDYAINDIAGADIVSAHGGRVMTVPFKYDRSTTKIVHKICEHSDFTSHEPLVSLI